MSSSSGSAPAAFGQETHPSVTYTTSGSPIATSTNSHVRPVACVHLFRANDELQASKEDAVMSSEEDTAPRASLKRSRSSSKEDENDDDDDDDGDYGGESSSKARRRFIARPIHTDH
jgi:hypothetical protein